MRRSLLPQQVRLLLSLPRPVQPHPWLPRARRRQLRLLRLLAHRQGPQPHLRPRRGLLDRRQDSLLLRNTVLAFLAPLPRLGPRAPSRCGEWWTDWSCPPSAPTSGPSATRSRTRTSSAPRMTRSRLSRKWTRTGTSTQMAMEVTTCTRLLMVYDIQ